MPQDLIAQITTQSHAELKSIVRQIAGADAVPIGDLTAAKIGRSAGHATAGIFLVTGRARTQSGEVIWSAVVKALGKPENRSPGMEYGALRELDVYRSEAFAEVCGGVRAAHWYAIQPRDDVQLLWLEDLSAAPQPPWETSHFLATARDLGRFNAHWPEDALPQWEWLEQDRLRADFTHNPHFQRAFDRLPENRSHPLMQTFLASTSSEQLAHLWHQCDELLVRAEQSSQGICHRDCHPKNLFPMRDAAAQSYTVAIDWVKVGTASLGFDVGHLLASPMTWLEVTPEEAAALRDSMFDAYLVGLADSGWSGNEDEVRLTYLTRLACEAIRNTRLITSAIENEAWSSMMERFMYKPIGEICTDYAAAREFFIDCLEEAQRVAQRL